MRRNRYGFTGIISTSHYIQGYYECDCCERKRLLEQIKKELLHSFPLPELYLGSEIYITAEMLELIKNGKASTINDTRYVLFELPMNTKPLFAKEIVYKLLENGYKPIIAHPERYNYIQKEIEYAKELASMGALFQANYGSIIGMYGSGAKKAIKELLKRDLISFLGSDVHRTNQIYPKIPKILKKLSKIISESKLEELTTLNARKVLNDENI